MPHRKDKQSGPVQSHSEGNYRKERRNKNRDTAGVAVPPPAGTKDVALIKGVDSSSASSKQEADPLLSKDVSQFLQGLALEATINKKDRSGHARSKANHKNTTEQAKSKPKEKERSVIGQPPTSTKKKPPNNEKNHQRKTASLKPEGHSTPLGTKEMPTGVSVNSKAQFIFPPTALWHTSLPTLATSPTMHATPTPAELSTLNIKAEELLQADTRSFQTSSTTNKSASEASFLAKIIQSGTLSDRLSGLTLLVQSSPLHNARALEMLRSMAERGKGQGGREESLKALRCVVDWWVGGGAPDRKLKYFRDQPLLHSAITNQHLLVWYFEDWLKKFFFSILQILEVLSLDPLTYVRSQALNLISTLLREKSEQEQNLLRLLVNKLGDTEKSICSRASYHLLQLMQVHPAMKKVIVREVISLVLRPTASNAVSTVPSSMAKQHIRFSDGEPKPIAEKKEGNGHARYYSTITFNQIVLTPADRDVALKLIHVYFEMFKELLGEGAGEDAGGSEEKERGWEEGQEVKVDKKGRVRQADEKKRKKKDVNVKGAAGFAEVDDSQSRLISAILTGVNRALPFAKIDMADASIRKHIDTLFLITHTSTFNISIQALVLIQQIAAALPSTSTNTSSTAKSIADRYYRTLYASLHDTRLATSSKQAMYLNLLFKSIKADTGNTDDERVMAVVRRFVQVLASGGGGATEFVAGGLFLLGELFSTIPGLRAMINQNQNPDNGTYDPRKRDPQYAHASCSPLWELTPLLHHYHPAISLHARQLLASQPLTASADLSQNTLSQFLDRFVYKNPKKIKLTESGLIKGKGSSAMQPAASEVDPSVGVKLMKGESGRADGELVNQLAFLRKREEDVPADQLFFHKFFTRKNENQKAMAAKAGRGKGDEEEDEVQENVERGGDDNETEDDDDDESGIDEAEVWKAMKASIPKAAGDDDSPLEDIDDEEVISGLDDESEGSWNLEGAVLDSGASLHGSDKPDNEDDDLSLVEGSDNEDLIPLGDMPSTLIEYDGSDAESGVSEDEAWGGIGDGVGAGIGKKRKREETHGEKRRKRKALPTFASYEDYAKMIEDGPENDV